MNKIFVSAIVFVFSTFVFLQCTRETASEPEPTIITEPVSTDPNVGCTDAAATNFKSTATEDDCSCKYDYLSKVSTKTPQDFTRKVLLEEHSGTWCGWCPLAKETSKKLTVSPSVISVEIHYNDEMTADKDKIYNPLKNKYGHPAWPSGMVNRRKSIVGSTFIIGESEWTVNVNDLLKTEKLPVGIALESSLNDKELTLMSHVKVNTATEDAYGLGIYLVEDKVAGFPQANYASRNTLFQKYEAYTLPSMIENILHENVARDAIAPLIGGLNIPAAAIKNGKVYKKLFKITLPNSVIIKENCQIVAFLMNQKTNEIVNVQIAPVGKLKDWD
ncbi:MAG: Omp28-related outer membrane protein [Emticicia sp.]|uniref:Omp28-related outer membrane protein n=1 Tax=Emticicia sp. TaxID=1930953 RepID=UPI003BA61118